MIRRCPECGNPLPWVDGLQLYRPWCSAECRAVAEVARIEKETRERIDRTERLVETSLFQDAYGCTIERVIEGREQIERGEYYTLEDGKFVPSPTMAEVLKSRNTPPKEPLHE